jgi:hypothetical protein
MLLVENRERELEGLTEIQGKIFKHDNLPLVMPEFVRYNRGMSC